MYISEHRVKNFRNIEDLSLNPDRGINIIFGENGQGKTNLIESLWLFTGCHSFRTRKNSQLIKEGCDKSRLELSFFALGRDQSARIELTDKKNVWLNGIHKDTPRRLIGEFPAVLFSPATLSIIKDGPGERRKFLDIAISLIKPNYAAVLSKYIKSLAERNALLRQCEKTGEASRELFFSWDSQLAQLGTLILKYRIEYIDMLKTLSAQIYSEITAGRESFSMRYETLIKGGEFDRGRVAQKLFDELEKNRGTDIRRQFTSVGPHKDDLIFTVNKKSARVYGSQGQQRSCALSLKLAEASILEHFAGEKPVILLDDVMSELDDGRQELLLERLQTEQVFITCCDPSQLLRLRKGRAFEITDGTAQQIV